jgi:predicted unusual protein kinase regulating ubiquinone biosynthesis (AarF/ABC1/UbiB family)
MEPLEESLRYALRQRLLAERRKLPTTTLRRLGRTGATGLRIGRAMLASQRGGADTEIDVESIAKIVSSIGQLKGITMKVGQIMSYIDVALPDELRDALSVLQTHAQPMPIEAVQAILRQELGSLADDLLTDLEPEPIAAASIGQVHRSRLPSGERVAVKVQYPEVERAIESDFKPAAIGKMVSAIVYPGARIDDFIAEARARFLEECDYVHEADAQSRFAVIYDDHPAIAVPAVYDRYCARRVLTSEWIEGTRFDAFLAADPSQSTRDGVGEALFGFYVGSLFEHGLYNCDPHPGNYLLLDDGRVGMLDYGCTRKFEPEFVARLAQLTRAVHRDEPELLQGAFLDLGMVVEGQRYDFDTARGLVRSFYGPMLHDTVQAIDLGEAMGMRQVFESKRELMKLRLPGEFLFLFRIRFGLMSVLAQLGARANWYRLERGWVEAALSAHRAHVEGPSARY